MITWYEKAANCCDCNKPVTSSFSSIRLEAYTDGALTRKATTSYSRFREDCPCSHTQYFTNYYKADFNYVKQESYTVEQTFMSRYTTEIDGEPVTSERQGTREVDLISTLLAQSSELLSTQGLTSTSWYNPAYKQGYISTTETEVEFYNSSKTTSTEGGTTSCPVYSTSLDANGKQTTTLITHGEGVKTWSKCTTSTHDTALDTSTRIIGVGWSLHTGCLSTLYIGQNTNDFRVVSVFVDPLLENSEYGNLRKLLKSSLLTDRETIVKTSERPPTGFLNESQFLKVKYTTTSTSSISFFVSNATYGGATTYKLTGKKVHLSEFTCTEHDFQEDHQDTTITISLISNYEPDTKTVQIDFKETTISHSSVSQHTYTTLQTAKTLTYNTGSLKNIASFKEALHPYFWGPGNDTVPYEIKIKEPALTHQLFDVTDSAENPDGKRSRVRTTLVLGEIQDQTSRFTATLKVPSATYRTENGSVISTPVDSVIKKTFGYTSKYGRSPANGFYKFSQYLTEPGEDKLLNASPDVAFFELSSLAYPAYQDIYDVGTSGMLYGELKAEFTTTLLGAQAATANSALIRQLALSGTKTSETTINSSATTTTKTVINLGSISNTVSFLNSQKSAEQLSYHTGLTQVYFTQKSYTATSWNEIETIFSQAGDKTFVTIIRKNPRTYSSSNYQREDGEALIHRYFRQSKLDSYGIGHFGGVYQNGEPREVTMQVIDYGIPFVIEQTVYGDNCEFTTSSRSFSEGTHTFKGTQITMFQTDQHWNVGALREILKEGTTIKESEYYKYKPIKLD